MLYDGPWVAERTAALRDVIEQHPDILHPVTRTILEGGLRRRTVDAFDAFHRLAEARRAAELCSATYDALLLPTAPFCPTLAEVAADPIGVNSRLGTFTNFVNLCDLAAFAVPAGFGSQRAAGRRDPARAGLVGGPAGRLADVTAPRNRRRVGAHARCCRPPPIPIALAPDETALFCIGAHMSGLS